LGEVRGRYFMAMEYVRGRNLATLLEVTAGLEQRLDIGMSAFIVAEVMRALAYAHTARNDEGKSLRIIHRDVSPSNIMLSYEGAVKLLDFGIAKALGGDSVDEGNTQRGTLKGKLAY